MALDEAIKITNRRVNALDNVHEGPLPPRALHSLTPLAMQVVVPRIENTIKYIESELDELEREDIFRCGPVCSLAPAPGLTSHVAG